MQSPENRARYTFLGKTGGLGYRLSCKRELKLQTTQMEAQEALRAPDYHEVMSLVTIKNWGFQRQTEVKNG